MSDETQHWATPPLAKLAEALAKAQAIITNAVKDRTNPHFGQSYATLGSIWDAVRAPLSANGLSVVQMVETTAGGVALTTTLLHASGESITNVLEMPVAKRDAQGIGSAITYARRYALAAMVGTAADEDDDADGAVAVPRSRPGDAPSRDERPAADLPTVFPNFGSLKGAPIRGAPVKDLEWYRGQSRKSLADPEKARFHAEESARIRAIDAELERQRAEGPPPDPLKKPATVVDVAEGETEEHAKMRSAGGYYAQAVALGKSHGRKQEETGKWLRTTFDRASKESVTEADVAAYRAHLAGEPPPDMKLPGQREPGAEG